MFTLSVAQLMTQMKQGLINVNNTFFFLFVNIVFTQHSFD